MSWATTRARGIPIKTKEISPSGVSSTEAGTSSTDDGRSSTGRRPWLWSQRTMTTSPTIRCPGRGHVGEHGQTDVAAGAERLEHGSRRGHAVLGEVDHAAAFEPPVDRRARRTRSGDFAPPRSPPRTVGSSPAPGWSACAADRRRRRARAGTTRARRYRPGTPARHRSRGPPPRPARGRDPRTPGTARRRGRRRRRPTSTRSGGPPPSRRPTCRRRTRRPGPVAGTAGCPSRRRTCRRRPPRRTAGRPPGRERPARRAPGSRRPST